MTVQNASTAKGSIRASAMSAPPGSEGISGSHPGRPIAIFLRFSLVLAGTVSLLAILLLIKLLAQWPQSPEPLDSPLSVNLRGSEFALHNLTSITLHLEISYQVGGRTYGAPNTILGPNGYHSVTLPIRPGEVVAKYSISIGAQSGKYSNRHTAVTERGFIDPARQTYNNSLRNAQLQRTWLIVFAATGLVTFLSLLVTSVRSKRHSMGIARHHAQATTTALPVPAELEGLHAEPENQPSPDQDNSSIRGALMAEEQEQQSATAMLQRAKALFAQRCFPECEAMFERVLSIDPCNVGALFGLGAVRFKASDFNSATEYFTRCLKVNPQHADSYFYLGLIAAARKAPEEAQSFYRRALDLNPHHALALQHYDSSLGGKRTDNNEGNQNDSGVERPRTNEAQQFLDVLRYEQSYAAQKARQLLGDAALQVTTSPCFSSYMGKVFSGIALALLGFVYLSQGQSSQPSTIPSFPFLVLAITVLWLESLFISRGKWVTRAKWFLVIHALLWMIASTVVPIGAATVLTQVADSARDVAGMCMVTAFCAALMYAFQMQSTTYYLTDGCLRIERGIMSRTVTNIELYRVLDLSLKQSWLNRMTGDGILLLFVEGVHGPQETKCVELVGLAKISELSKMFNSLRSVILFLRSGPWGKGMIY